MKPRRDQHDNVVQGVDPRFMAPTPQYDADAIVAGMAAGHRPHQTYPVDLQPNIDPFGSTFANNPMEAGADQYFNMDYETPGVTYEDPNGAAQGAYANPTGGINPNQTFINSPGTTTHHSMGGYPQNGWSHQYPGPGRQHYSNGRP